MKTIEHHKRHGLRFRGLGLSGAPSLVRLIGCLDAIFEDCILSRPSGPPDPHGCCIQLINSTATIRRCRFVAGPRACDLLSNYGDNPNNSELPPVDAASGAQVLVEDCRFEGTGDADFTTSICNDGAFAVFMLVRRTTIIGARVGVGHASGSMRLEQVTTRKSREQSVWSDGQYYVGERRDKGEPVRPGRLYLNNCDLDKPFGTGKLPGKVVVVGQPKPAAAPPKRPAGWSVKRFLAWLSRRK